MIILSYADVCTLEEVFTPYILAWEWKGLHLDRDHGNLSNFLYRCDHWIPLIPPWLISLWIVCLLLNPQSHVRYWELPNPFSRACPAESWHWMQALLSSLPSEDMCYNFVPFPYPQSHVDCQESHALFSQSTVLSCKDNEHNPTLPHPSEEQSQSCAPSGSSVAAEVHMPSVGLCQAPSLGICGSGVYMSVFMNLYPFLCSLLLPDSPAMVVSSVFLVHQDK